MHVYFLAASVCAERTPLTVPPTGTAHSNTCCVYLTAPPPVPTAECICMRCRHSCKGRGARDGKIESVQCSQSMRFPCRTMAELVFRRSIFRSPKLPRRLSSHYYCGLHSALLRYKYSRISSCWFCNTECFRSRNSLLLSLSRVQRPEC